MFEVNGFFLMELFCLGWKIIGIFMEEDNIFLVGVEVNFFLVNMLLVIVGFFGVVFFFFGFG